MRSSGDAYTACGDFCPSICSGACIYWPAAILRMIVHSTPTRFYSLEAAPQRLTEAFAVYAHSFDRANRALDALHPVVRATRRRSRRGGRTAAWMDADCKRRLPSPSSRLRASRTRAKSGLPAGVQGIYQWLTNVVHLLVPPRQSKAALWFCTIRVKWREGAVQQNRLCVLH